MLLGKLPQTGEVEVWGRREYGLSDQDYTRPADLIGSLKIQFVFGSNLIERFSLNLFVSIMSSNVRIVGLIINQ